MARIPEGPWFWKQKQQYAVTIRGKRHLLGEDEEEAKRQFHELMSKKEDEPPPPAAGGITMAEAIDKFLAWTLRERAKETYLWYQEHLQSFLDSLPKLMLAEEVKAHHVEDWANAHKWGGSRTGGAMTAVARVFNWALKKELIQKNPIHGRLDKPRPGKRDRVISPKDFTKIQKHLRGNFQDLVITAWETGARPQELVKVEARHVDLENGRWVFPVEESKGKTAQRIIYLSEKALGITKRLLKKNKSGRLFRTCFGNPWDKNKVSHAFIRLQKKVGVKYRMYDFRFSFCTNGLKNGVDPITMQHLMGHKDLSMISKIYALVGQDHQHMRNAAMKAAMRGK